MNIVMNYFLRWTISPSFPLDCFRQVWKVLDAMKGFSDKVRMDFSTLVGPPNRWGVNHETMGITIGVCWDITDQTLTRVPNQDLILLTWILTFMYPELILYPDTVYCL